MTVRLNQELCQKWQRLLLASPVTMGLAMKSYLRTVRASPMLLARMSALGPTVKAIQDRIVLTRADHRFCYLACPDIQFGR